MRSHPPDICQALQGQRTYVAAAELDLGEQLSQPQDNCWCADFFYRGRPLSLHMHNPEDDEFGHQLWPAFLEKLFLQRPARCGEIRAIQHCQA